jgi:hypothetical protein
MNILYILLKNYYFNTFDHTVYMSADQRLTKFTKEGKDWERKATSIPGIFLLKLHGLRSTTAPSLAIEINPVDSTGSATKKRGVVIRSSYELEQIKKLLSNPKLPQLAKSMDEVNPEVKRLTATKESDIFEI